MYELNGLQKRNGQRKSCRITLFELSASVKIREFREAFFEVFIENITTEFIFSFDLLSS